MHENKSIGFFGGSFDPIHFGHIHLALCMQEIYGLDQILFCPAYTSPLKIASKPSASSEHRKEMVRLAISSLPHFSLYDFEVSSQKPCYTVDTVRHLKDTFTQQKRLCDLYLILGDDAVKDLHKWKEIDELFSLAQPLIGTRDGCDLSGSLLSDQSKKCVSKGLTTIPVLDISSTFLRQRLKKRLFAAHLIPASVLEYIYQNKLYE